MSTAVAELCRQKLREARDLGATTGFFSLDRNGTQVVFDDPDPRNGHYAFYLLPPNATASERNNPTVRWANGNNAGTYVKGTARIEPIPRIELEVLSLARPLPNPNLYGYFNGSRLVTIIDERARGGRFVTSVYVREGEREPNLWKTAHGTRYTVMETWWAGVKDGTIRPISRLLQQAQQPALWNRRGRGCYILMPALPRLDTGPAVFTRGMRITLGEAQQLGGEDFRKRLGNDL